MSSFRIFSVLLSLALAGGVYLWVSSGADSGARGDAADAAVETSEATALNVSEGDPVRVLAAASVARPMADALVLRGVSEADRKVRVSAQTGGLVISNPRPRGSAVEAGDLLCQIEAGDRRAQLAEARARLKQAETDAEASSALTERGFRAETQMAADDAALEAAKALVARIELDIVRTRIIAPFDGRLETDSAEYGERLEPGSLCATVLALDPIRFVGHAPESAIDAIEIGAATTVRLIGGEEISATVSFASRSADPETRTFRVEATASNSDERIRDGATAEMSIALRSTPAHLLPHSALTLDDAGRVGVRTVRRSESAQENDMRASAIAAFAPVEILSDGAEGVWLGGLADQIEVILMGQDFVRAGAPIEPHIVDLERVLSGDVAIGDAVQ